MNVALNVPEAPWSEDRPLGSLLQLERLSRWTWVLGYTAVLSTLAALQYRLGLIPATEVGALEQGLWQLFHHGIRASGTLLGYPLLADQASYTLVPLAPVYALGGVGALVVLQAFVLGLGYVLVLALGHQLDVPPPLAHTVGLIYLLHPVVLGTALSGFHPEALAVPLLLGLVRAAEGRHPLRYAVLLSSVLLVTLWAPLVGSVVGVILLARGQRTWGVLTTLVSAFVGIADLDFVLPSLAHGPAPWWRASFAALGPTPTAGIAALVAHPALALAWVKRPQAWASVLFLWGPVIALLLTRPGRPGTLWWVPALVLSEAGLLSSRPILTSPFLLAVPFLMAASLVALRGETPGSRGRPWILWPILAALLITGIAWFGPRADWADIRRHLPALYAAVDSVPQDAPVAADGTPLAHLANREGVWTLGAAARGGLPPGTYVIVGGEGTSARGTPEVAGKIRQVLDEPGRAQIILSRDGVTVYRLVKSLPPGPWR